MKATAAKTTAEENTVAKSTPAITKPKPADLPATASAHAEGDVSSGTEPSQSRPPLSERVMEHIDAVVQSRPSVPTVDVALDTTDVTSREGVGDAAPHAVHSLTTTEADVERNIEGEAMADDAGADSALAAEQLDHEPDDAAGGTPRRPQPAVPAPVEPELAEPASAEPGTTEPEADSESAEPAEENSDALRAAETPDTARPAFAAETLQSATAPALVARGLVKNFGGMRAVDQLDLTVPAGTFYGIVGPNGAGKTTTLSMLAGLLRPDSGTVSVAGIDVKSKPRDAKKLMGVLPDRFRTFDRLTGRQLLHYYGALRGLSSAVITSRAEDLARAFDLTEALARPVADYSAGMTKKVMLAGALIHSPRLLVLDEPFESVDPVSAAVILDILTAFVKGGGTVILSSHGMDLVEKVCSRVAVIVSGQVLAEGTVEEVRDGLTLEQRFVELSGGLGEVEGLEWLHTSSD